MNFKARRRICFSVVNDKCRFGIFTPAAAEFSSHDRTWIQRKRAAISGDFELMIVPEANNIVDAGFGYRSRKIIEVVYGKPLPIEIDFAVFAVEPHMGIELGLGCNAEEIGIVVPENYVDITRKTCCQLVDYEGRAEIATADQSVATANKWKDDIQFPEIVMDVRQNCDFHKLGPFPE